MNKTDQKFCASFAKGAKWAAGPRSFFEYRNLGIDDATHGAFHAHVIRLRERGNHERGTGPHKHDLKFQMFYVLKGWIRFVYDGQGERTFHEGDCVLQPPGIVHNELECSDDLQVLEIYSPAVHPTVVVEKMPEAVAAG
ncbi:MAG: cupin domain-containing protein [Candidatus Rokuibacteriota bacterium]